VHGAVRQRFVPPQVVPTTYTNIRNVTVSTNQYSVSEYFKSSDASAGSNLPGIFCFFDLSPIKVRAHVSSQAEHNPFLSFILFRGHARCCH